MGRIRVDQAAARRLGVTGVMLEMLAAAARGELASDTSVRTGLSVDAIRSRRARMFRVLGARTMTHAVALAFAEGVLRVVDDAVADVPGAG